MTPPALQAALVCLPDSQNTKAAKFLATAAQFFAALERRAPVG